MRMMISGVAGVLLHIRTVTSCDAIIAAVFRCLVIGLYIALPFLPEGRLTKRENFRRLRSIRVRSFPARSAAHPPETG